MGEYLFNTLQSLFAGSLITEVSNFISDVVDASDAFFSGQVGDMIDILLVIAGTLMTIFLFIDIMNKASQEMITLERLVLILIRYFLAMLVLIYLKEIIVGLFQIISLLYQLLAEQVGLFGTGGGTGDNPFSGLIEFFPDDGNPNPNTWPTYDEVRSAFEGSGYKSGISSYISNFGLFMLCIVISLITWLAKMVAFLITVSTAIALIARAIMAPIGVVQLFDEGMRSAGILYLKKFLAEGLTFFAIIAVLYASSLLQANLIAIQADDVLNGVLSVSAIEDLFNGGLIVTVLAIQLSTVGAMFKAGALAKDVVGVH